MPAVEQSERRSLRLEVTVSPSRLPKRDRGSSAEVKLLFSPIGILAGLAAGAAAQKAFDGIWSLFDDEEPPAPDHRAVSYPKLAAALVVEGAVFRLTKGLVDHAVRRGFAGATGSWPGEDEPDPA